MGAAMIGRTEKILLILWPILLAGAALMLYFAPMATVPFISIVMLPFFPLPTLFLYYTAALPFYFAIRLAPIRHARIAAAVAALAVPLLAGWQIAQSATETTKAELAQILKGEKFAPIQMEKVNSVALIGGDYYPPPECSDFCLTLLLSGTAQEILVAGPGDKVTRYTLAANLTDCVTDSELWRKYFSGVPFDRASRTGGYPEVLTARYARCIASSDAQSLAADLTFVETVPRDDSAYMFAGLDLSLDTARVRAMEQLIDNRGGHALERIRRIDYAASLLDRPLWIMPVTAPFGSAEPGDWAQAPYLPRDRTPFLSGWWALIANGDALYAKATAVQ